MAMFPIPTSEAPRKAKRNGAAPAHVNERPLGLDDLIAAVLRIVDDEGADPALAAARVLGTTTPDTETAGRLMARGLASFTEDVRHRLNRYQEPTTPAGKDERAEFLGRYQLHTTHSPARLADVLERVTLRGLDRVKPLLDFTMDDVKAFRARADAAVAGWTKRVGVMSVYEAMLTKHKAETGRDLPADAVSRIRKAADKTWL
jgi:hypothetical protein